MKSLILILIFSSLLVNCGFKPIYSSKNSKYEIIEITNKNKNKNSFAIAKTVMSISNDDATKKVKLEMDYKQTISTILKDSKGDPSKNKLIINVGLTVKNEKNKVLVTKSFREEFSYEVQSNKFNMSQYVEGISNNLINKISNDIIFLLATLK